MKSKVQITNVSVYGLEEAIVASKFPLLKKPYTEEEFRQKVQELREFRATHTNEEFLASEYVKTPARLAACGSGEGHDCYLKGITVCFRIEYPVYWSPQLQRYHFIDFVSSSSTMHRVLDVNPSELCKDFPSGVASNLVAFIDGLQEIAKTAENPDDRKEAFHQLVAILPQGQIKVAYLTTNYLQLKTILKQRKQHKLIEWREFCNQIEANCPLLVELTKGEIL